MCARSSLRDPAARPGIMRRTFAGTHLLVVSCARLPRAQSTSASISSHVSDASRARVTEARVTAIGTATNVRYETTSSESGEYHLANLPPGAYRLEIEKAGFKKLVRPAVELHVQDALEI